jgi:hypothetical protein
VTDIAVTRTGPGEFKVVVDGTHSYEVTGADDENLVRESFVFLLEREPPSSILKRFSLDVISGYFPEYPEEIRRRLGES